MKRSLFIALSLTASVLFAGCSTSKQEEGTTPITRTLPKVSTDETERAELQRALLRPGWHSVVQRLRGTNDSMHVLINRTELKPNGTKDLFVNADLAILTPPGQKIVTLHAITAGFAGERDSIMIKVSNDQGVTKYFRARIPQDQHHIFVAFDDPVGFVHLLDGSKQITLEAEMGVIGSRSMVFDMTGYRSPW